LRSAFVERYADLDLLRFLTCGEVDHGKSTLIGRLLYDSRSVPDDHIRAARANTRHYTSSNDLEFAMLVDGLRAEREQGITIDVAYRYFSTPKRKFIIADAPGHEQYTRNMVTAASNCDLAVVLVDACNGVTEQTRRHAFVASLLGIRHLVLAVNKMDLVEWDERRFDEIRRAFTDFSARLEVTDIDFIPMSASNGDNVVDGSRAMPWYAGRPLLGHLENVHVASDRNMIDLRLPVQIVVRPEDGSRWLAGTVASGVIRRNDEVVVLPAKRRARVAALATGGVEVDEAFASMAVEVRLDRSIDISRGDLLAHPQNIPTIEDEFDAMLVWMGEDALATGREYVLKSACGETACVATDLRYRIDVRTIRRESAVSLEQNEIGRARITAAGRRCIDSYARNRAMGAFILIDRMTNETVAAGMIVDRDTAEQDAAPDDSRVTLGDRKRRFLATARRRSGYN
jgi:bifunctional enzyme CysN/CysC